MMPNTTLQTSIDHSISPPPLPQLRTARQRVTGALLSAMLAATAALISLAPLASVTEQNDVPGLLSPTEQQRQVSGLARRYIGRFHYQPVAIDDALSIEIFDQYLESLDPSKAYLLQSDIDYFLRYKTRLDDYLRRDDAAPAFEIFNIYRQRVAERIAVAQQHLHKGFTFDVPEQLQLDRSDADWASSTAELDEYWRQRVKNDWLRLKLTDKDEQEILETLSNRYNELQKRIAELDSQDVFQFYLNSYLSAVEPHTSYLSPRTSENFEIAMSLSFEGIGALLGNEGEYTIIRSIIPGGPADLDKRLQPGDRIVAVTQGRDGETQDVVGWRIDDVVKLIRGAKGSVVKLNVLPADSGLQGPAVDIDITRNEIQLEEQAAKSQILEIPDIDADGKLSTVRIGVVDLPTFYLDFEAYSENRPDYRSSTQDVRKLVNQLKREGVDGLVIDLRDNGGGSLLEATTLTGLFIDKGPVVQVKDNRERVSIHEDNEPGTVWNGPLAVLVNRYSASASEIFAAALQDYGRALIIGEPTYGKGTVQNLIDLDQHLQRGDQVYGQLKMTMAQFFRIDGGSTQNRGVIPDIQFPSPEDADEYGESANSNALPWSHIEPVSYRSSSKYDELMPAILSQYQQRLEQDPEFAYLRDDIIEYQARKKDEFISLLESDRRAQMQSSDQRREQRKLDRKNSVAEIRHIPIGNVIAETTGSQLLSLPEDEVAIEGIEDDSGEDDFGAVDLFLEEAARIVADLGLLLNQGRPLAGHDKVAALLATNSDKKNSDPPADKQDAGALTSAVNPKSGLELPPEG